MRKLGWTECDIVELDVDDLKATALGIALNRTAELAEWDEPVLAKLLEELKNEDALDGIGYSAADVDQLLAESRQRHPRTSTTPAPRSRRRRRLRVAATSGLSAITGSSAETPPTPTISGA